MKLHKAVYPSASPTRRDSPQIMLLDENGMNVARLDVAGRDLHRDPERTADDIARAIDGYARLRAACEPIRDNLAAAEWSDPEEAERILVSVINGYWPALRAALADE